MFHKVVGEASVGGCVVGGVDGRMGNGGRRLWPHSPGAAG